MQTQGLVLEAFDIEGSGLEIAIICYPGFDRLQHLPTLVLGLIQVSPPVQYGTHFDS